MKLILSLLFSSLTLCYCSVLEVNYEKLALAVQQEAAKEISQKYHLDPIGFGGGMIDQINCMSLMFSCQENIDMDVAHEILHGAADLFLEKVNNSDTIRPYLSKYPADLENIEIIIYPGKKYDSPNEKPIRAMSIHDNRLHFLTPQGSKFEKFELSHAS